MQGQSFSTTNNVSSGWRSGCMNIGGKNDI